MPVGEALADVTEAIRQSALVRLCNRFPPESPENTRLYSRLHQLRREHWEEVEAACRQVLAELDRRGTTIRYPARWARAAVAGRLRDQGLL